jgi:hypothetical protein
VPVVRRDPPASAISRPGWRDAVASPQRTSLLPDADRESGMPGFESVLHYGLLAPAGTSRPINDKLTPNCASCPNEEVKSDRTRAATR